MMQGCRYIDGRWQTAVSGRERTVINTGDGLAITRVSEVGHICRNYETRAVNRYGV
jgi:hypothetical protein